MFLSLITTQNSHVMVQSGIELGSVLAMLCSWQRNRSILWAIIAALFSWIYVVYFAITRNSDETK